MKKLLFILPSLLIMGCSVQKDMDCCGSCDEFYPFTNCPDPIPVYHYRSYKRTWSSTPTWRPYYPNTQTVYYVPVQEPVITPVNNGTIISNTPRPERLGEYRERPSKPVNNNTRSTRD